MSKHTHTIGRRKESRARIFLLPGKGKLEINDKPFEKYFVNPRDREVILHALRVTNKEKAYDMKITVKGGGTTGQKEAIRHGISRAIALLEEETRPVLKKLRYITRDAREVLPKRYGLKKHRKKEQFSKR